MTSLSNPPLLTSVGWQIKAANYTANSGDRIVADVSSGAWSLSLPANPAVGEEIQILTFGAGTNALTINPNGKNLNGASTAMVISGDRLETHFVFLGAAGWISAVGGGSASPSPSPSPGPSPTPTLNPWQFQKQDTTTLGNWGGAYGSAGYILFNWNYGGNDVSSVPTYFNGYSKTDAAHYNFTVNDQRALPNNPQNTGERRSALLFGATPTFEVFISDATVRKVSLYLCDFDGTRGAVRVKIQSLTDETKTAERLLTAENYDTGVYCQFSYSGSFKLTVSEPNINNILSALFFD